MDAEEQSTEKSMEMPRARAFRWGFASASAMTLVLMVAGQAVGVMLDGFGVGGMQPRDWIFSAFLASAGWLCFLQRSAIWRFLRTVQVGVSLVAMTTLAVAVGVLVPQIDGFEDPDQRVTAANYEEQYAAFRWAEGYFLYHLLHPYGIGMPEAELPPGLDERLEAFGRRYGREEEKNRKKQMASAFASGPKSNEIGAFVERHDALLRRAFDVCTALHLNRTYKSWWFATLLGLLGASVFANTWRGKPARWLSIEKIGFVTTHVGILVMLVGGAVSKSQTVRGILHLDLEREPQNEFWAYHSPDDRRAMPFWLHLQRFARKDWRQLEVGFADDRFSSRPPTYTLWEGRTIDLDFVADEDGGLRPRVRLEVLGLHDRAEVSEWLLSEAGEEHAGEGLGPVLELTVPDYQGLLAARASGVAFEDMPRLSRSEFLSPAYPGQDVYHDLAWQVRIKAVFGDPDAGALFPAEEIVGTLELRDLESGDVQAQRVPFGVGDTLEAPGGYRIVVSDATAAYRVDREELTEIRDERPLAEQPPHAPAVWLDITPPDGGEVERRLVHERVDAEKHGKLEQYTHDHLVVRLEWERWASAGPPRFVLAWNEDGEARLHSEAQPEAGGVVLSSGDPLSVPGSIVFENAYADAFADKQVLFLEERLGVAGFEEDFYSSDPSGLELRITQDPGTVDETSEVVRLATTEHSLADRWQSGDERFHLSFFENDAVMPYEWRSVLTVFDEDPDGRWHVYSGVDGRLIETRDAADSRLLGERHGTRVIALEDIDGDGQRDFAGPVLRLDTGSEREREIRVNDYLTHAGYRFFQTNAIPQIPTYSGIGVVYDPGIPTVLTGMYTIIAGTVLAFLVRPIVLARRKRRGSAA